MAIVQLGGRWRSVRGHSRSRNHSPLRVAFFADLAVLRCHSSRALVSSVSSRPIILGTFCYSFSMSEVAHTGAQLFCVSVQFQFSAHV